MSADQAYDLLGVREGAGFDDILTAKNRLTKANEHDQDKVVRVSVHEPSTCHEDISDMHSFLSDICSIDPFLN